MTDIVAEIWAAVAEGAEIDTAEARVAIDRALRQRLDAIEDRDLRHHAARLIAARRAALFGPGVRGETTELMDDVAELRWRVEALERGERYEPSPF